MNSREPVQEQDAVSIHPPEKKVPGESDVVQGIDNIPDDACDTEPQPDSRLKKKNVSPLESEDGEMFLNSEGDIDY